MSFRQKGRLAALISALMGLFGGGVALAQGDVPVQSLLHPAGPQARMLHEIMMFDVWGTMIIFVIVSLVVLYAIFRFGFGGGKELPPQVEGNKNLEIGWTLALVAGLLIFLVHPVQAEIDFVNMPEDPEAIEVRVIGHQWWWEFQYPEANITTANELVIPAGRQVNLKLTSTDVIHSFGVPRLGGKDEAMPGRWTRMWLEADEPGTYQGQCMQLCGKSHARMYFRVVAKEQADYDAWVKGMKNLKAPSGRGAEVFNTKCAACHTVDPTRSGTIGPNLAMQGARTSIGGGIRENTAEDLAQWIREPQSLKPGAFMPGVEAEGGAMPPNQSKFPATGLTDDDISALVEFLHGMK